MKVRLLIEKIRKRDGRIEDFNKEKIKNAILKAFIATGEGDGREAERIAEKVVRKAEKEFRYDIPGVENIQDIVEEVLVEEGFAKVAKAYILYREKRAEVRRLKKFFGVQDELKLNVNAIKVLQRRYLLRNEKGEVIETPAQLFMRVAESIAGVDGKYDEGYDRTVKEFFDAMSSLLFLPNSPTLMNAGTELGQLSACFVIKIEDSLESIFDALKHMAIVQQSGGGTGFSFSRLRPKGDIVRSTRGVASGPVSFMRIFDVATDVIKQGGKRRGANMGILKIDHPDVVDFITSKQVENVLENFNISVGVTHAFMDSVEGGKEYSLVNPRNGKVVKKVSARDIFDLIVNSTWQSGEPGLIFIDEVNRHNPTPALGDIESTNPCITGDTQIATSRGLERIADVVDKDREMLVDPRLNGGKPQLRKAVKIFRTGFKKVYTLRTRCGYELRATAGHPLLTPSGWKNLSELKPGDRVLIQSAGCFSKNYGLPVDVQKINTLTGRRLNLPTLWSEELGVVLGWLIGDGALTGKKAIFYFCMEEIELMPYFATILKKWNMGREVEPHEYEGVPRLQYHENGMVEFFFGLGVKKAKSLDREVPMAIFTAPEETVAGFLRALFTANGAIGTGKNNGEIWLRSASERLLKQVQLLLLNFGIKSRGYTCRHSFSKPFDYTTVNGEDRFYRSGKNQYYELVITRESIGRFAREIGFLPGKKHKAFLEKISDRRGSFYADSFEDEVVSIEESGEEDVYDLKEPEYHSFIANGMVVHNCGEVPLLPYESCNLGSINLSKVVKKGEIDWELLGNLTRLGVHFLDNVIDVNMYPLKEIEGMTKANRKIGLGVMGFADLLLILGIPYDSQEALDTAEKIISFISEEAREESRRLALSRGSFPNFEVSIYASKYDALRNATVTTIAPTGTISIIAGTTSGIEPLFAVSFVRDVLEGTKLLEVNPVFEKVARERGFYSKELMLKIAKTGSLQGIAEIPEDIKRVFVTALDISYEFHVRMQAAFQKYVDNAVSKTINMPSTAGLEDVRNAFWLAYRLGCKGITVYRYGSREKQVLYIGEEHVRAGSEYSGGCPTRECVV